MSTVTTIDTAPARSRAILVPAWLSINHAATIFVSAFLLFEVQPLISKFILPWFGGSPAVWTTAMLFFQILLFGGYTYAHLVSNRLSPRGQAAVHVGLLLAAVAMLPITPSESWKPTDAADPTLRILLLLGMNVGLPYFVLSTTGPLIQAWFSRAHVGRSPYRLYSLSNVGSLLALVSYPIVIEPVWDAFVQSRVWSIAFVAFALLAAVAAIYNALIQPQPLRSRKTDASVTPAAANTYAESIPLGSRRLLWVGLPALASLMLLATTNHVCQDVAVVPFLWVIPLGLYLLTFIISFDHSRWYQPLFIGTSALVCVLGVAGIHGLKDFIEAHTGYVPNFVQELVLYFATMFLVCMMCHGELVRLRPDPKHLTEFFLMISAGGALGGIFVSLLAPRVFSTFFEWKIALVAALVVAIVVIARSLKAPSIPGSGRLLAGAALSLAGGVCILWWQTSNLVPIDRARNFYGIVSVFEEAKEDPLRHNRLLRHGAIAHGRQYLHPDRRHEPLSYYYESSGLGKAIAFLQRREKLHVGTIGLGVGTTATYARPGDRYRFYEINPEVVRQANEFFTFLKDCKCKPEIIMGDGRLALEREAPQNFDLLICDAFSGDSIPMHLATLEAFEIYKKHMQPDGILAVNITNSYIDIFPMLRAMADRIGYKWTRTYVRRDSEKFYYRTDWLLLTNNQEFLDQTPSDVPAERMTDKVVPIWTDHFSSLWDVLKN